MAYNLQPLITILEGILDPHQPRWIVDENNPQLQSLFDKATSLQKLLHSNSSFTKLDTQIREVTHQAEDILESHMVHHMLSGSDCVRFTLSTPDLQQVTRHLDSLMEQAEKLLEMGDEKMLRDLDSSMEQLKLVDNKMPSRSSSSSKSVVVGIDEDLMQLQDRLTQAEDWLKSLVDRNLFMVRLYKYGQPKSYSMHDMLRDLCIRKCDEDKFMNGPNKFTYCNPRRMSFHSSNELEDVNDSTESMSLTRSVVICIGFRRAKFPSGALFAARLLRVLDLRDMRFSTFPAEIFEFVNLRFLGVYCSLNLPRGISRLWNLQTLIARYCKFDEPAELWKLSELRHLEVDGIELLKDEAMKYSVLKKLQSIVSVIVPKDEATSLDGFLKRVPNIKKLVIDDRDRTRSMAIDLSHLHMLEILRFWWMRNISSPNGFGHCFTVIFPCNIRKLYLHECEMILGAWRTVCALHKLEVLEIYGCSFNKKWYDEEWELADRDVFPSLQFLHLAHLRIVRWIADETNFPRLRHLCVYIIHQSRWIVDENNPQLQSLYNKATSLQKLLDSKSSFTQIREVTHQAEDILESHMVDCMLSGSDCVRFTLSTPDLQQVTRHLDSVMEQAETLMEMEDKKMPREIDSAMEDKKMLSSRFKREEETCDEKWELADEDVFPSLQCLYLQDLLHLVRWISI
ncbi:hypothetical protein SASPL_113193 [Salvia splendens]|uniref:Disease resistance R13L4/SHOC-2-like LRR domain-containing protein n=1 Tax=Salvia splendens TaxID=180675 RepID=A0A8X8Y2C4_SALSN|nr:hypothetical protein SASPL_113193 [Salvia splendens]